MFTTRANNEDPKANCRHRNHFISLLTSYRLVLHTLSILILIDLITRIAGPGAGMLVITTQKTNGFYIYLSAYTTYTYMTRPRTHWHPRFISHPDCKPYVRPCGVRCTASFQVVRRRRQHVSTSLRREKSRDRTSALAESKRPTDCSAHRDVRCPSRTHTTNDFEHLNCAPCYRLRLTLRIRVRSSWFVLSSCACCDKRILLLINTLDW